MVHTLTLNIPDLDIASPTWLFARTCKLFNKTGLMVYKSLMVKDTDEIYEEVRDFIRKYKFRVVRKGVFIDVDMVFGEGEWTLYLETASGPDGREPSPMVLGTGDIEEVLNVAKQMAGATN